MMKQRLFTLLMAVFMVVGMYAAAMATPHAPTNGGNGAGQSGQCTGAASARPAACKSP